jgi:hypothetical protein
MTPFWPPEGVEHMSAVRSPVRGVPTAEDRRTPHRDDPLHRRGPERLALVAVKTVHTGAFFSIATSLCYFAYAGAARRSDRRAAVAAAVVTGEALLYAANGFRCPLTRLAQRLGDDHPSVADIYLPSWTAAHIPHITAPMFTVALVLHTRNLVASRRRPRP